MIKARYQKMYTEKHKQDMDFVVIGDRYVGPFVDMNTAQRAVDAINSQFMYQTKPRTRTEYEKVTESIFDLRDEFERGELYADDKGIVKIQGLAHLGGCCQVGVIYRKVEKEIDERQEFIESASGLISKSHTVDYCLGKMFDAGCRFQD